MLDLLVISHRVGLGQRLMNHVLTAAANTPGVDKTMLSCFRRNDGARRFYERMGFETDASSPRERKLRSGKVVSPEYRILSCSVEGRGR